jgi:hypothetical protein
VRGPAVKICIAGTRTVSFFISFLASAKARVCRAFRALANRTSSFFSIIAAEFAFPQVEESVAIQATAAEAHPEDSAWKAVSVRRRSLS